jgi:TP901-1 family phage major tail protein
MRGVDILLMVEGATAETWVPVGGQRSASLNESVETIDTTSKDSGGNYEYDYGLAGWTVSCDGVHVSGEENFGKLKAAMRAKEKIKIRITESTGATPIIEEGMALVISRDLEAPYDAEVTYAVELQGTGALTTV